MAARIVLFGATGYTGRLVASELVEKGAKPLLAGRSESKLRAMADELGGGLDTAVADVARPDSVKDLVERGDVLLATVGPFVRWGAPAIDAAIAKGAWYIDSTGEAPFIREVFERRGPGAEAAGTALVTALGFDWTPGNLAGGLALREAGAGATALDVAYFVTGKFGVSGGTRASAVAGMLEPTFAWRDGRIVSERAGKRAASFQVDGEEMDGMSIGASEQFSLPRVHPGLREVNVYLGSFGVPVAVARGATAALAAAASMPGGRNLLDRLMSKALKGSTGGPGADDRAKGGSRIVAIARDAAGETLSEIRLEGVNAYTFTGRILSWGARTAAANGLKGAGALGPVEAFGLDELEQGVAESGIARAA